jgi:methylmalonyl-CoA/ethylmalonyl-CoA epimerase
VTGVGAGTTGGPAPGAAAGIPILTGRWFEQVGVVVADLDEAVQSNLALWRGNDWGVWEYGPGTVRQVTYRGSVVDASWRAALTTGTPQLELIQSITGPNIYTEWIETHGYGLHHVGVVVESLDEAISQMTAAGFEPIQWGIGFGLDGDGGYAYFDTSAQLGFMVEAIVRPERRREPLATYSG